jgi:hypothetical protein
LNTELCTADLLVLLKASCTKSVAPLPDISRKNVAHL